MNNIVHPKVGKHFDKWLSKQDHAYAIKEAAILFENGSFKNYDFIISVIADKDIRIKRLLNRDRDATKEKIKAIMDNQWDDEERIKLSDFIIYNNELKKTKEQVWSINQELLKLSE